jgi:hypothetical protein
MEHNSFNEFEDKTLLFYTSFQFLFMLGHGLKKRIHWKLKQFHILCSSSQHVFQTVKDLYSPYSIDYNGTRCCIPCKM